MSSFDQKTHSLFVSLHELVSMPDLLDLYAQENGKNGYKTFVRHLAHVRLEKYIESHS